MFRKSLIQTHPACVKKKQGAAAAGSGTESEGIAGDAELLGLCAQRMVLLLTIFQYER